MLVVDLLCARGHRFEGWFQSSDDLNSQKERGLLSCPICGGQDVHRLPSASRINLGAEPQASQDHRSAAEGVGVPSRWSQPEEPSRHTALSESAHQVVRDLQSAYLHAVRQVIQQTEDVGKRFPEEARNIHQGDEHPRAIRGEATPEEVEELREEGIDVMTFVVPDSLKGLVQ